MTVLPGKLPLALLVAQACCLPALAAPADSKSGGEQTLAPVVVMPCRAAGAGAPSDQ